MRFFFPEWAPCRGKITRLFATGLPVFHVQKLLEALEEMSYQLCGKITRVKNICQQKEYIYIHTYEDRL